MQLTLEDLKDLKSADDFKEWGWLIFNRGGQVKILEPGSQPLKLSEAYKATVMLRWHWDADDMWVFKNMWGETGVWVSQTTISQRPNHDNLG